jgi:outer membrane protein assembly factor BamD (BamD/ComL family)
MKQAQIFGLVCLLFIINISTTAAQQAGLGEQIEANEFYSKAVILHERGKYNEAIEFYKKRSALNRIISRLITAWEMPTPNLIATAKQSSHSGKPFV